MKKSTKGAAAAATAGILLLGGAGTLAFWTDAVTVGGGSINSGHISLDDTTGGNPGDCASAPWTLDANEDAPNETFDPLTGHIVPGDVLTKTCTFTVNAVGNHLRAILSSDQPTQSAGVLNTQTDVNASYLVDGNPQSVITEADNGRQVVATIELTFPGLAATNASQDKALNIGNYTVTATQTHN